MDKFFKISERGSSISTEFVAGLTTFLTMSYIIFVNPAVLAKAGMDSSSVLVATCIAAAVGTLIMGLYANYPFAQAPGMGLNAFFVYTVVLSMGYTWQQGLGIVFLSGLIFLILTVTGFRNAMIKVIPANLKFAIAPGIGLFIALIGLNNAGLIRVNQGPIIDIVLGGQGLEAGELINQINNAPSQIIQLGNLADPAVWLTVLSFIALTILMVLKVRGAMLWSILGTTILAVLLGVSQLPSSFDLSNITLAGTAFQLDVAGLFAVPEGQTFASVLFTIILIVISFTIVDLFDTLGTLLGTAAKGDMLDDDGNLPRMNKALLSDAIATLSGSLLGTATVTTYIESGSGIVAGGRTGLTAVVTAGLFLLAILLAPIAGIVPAAATSPILIMVGIMMLDGIRKIDLSSMEYSLPALMLIIFMPFTYSIANGVAIGIIFHVVIQLAKGKGREVHPILYVLVGLFVLHFVMH